MTQRYTQPGFTPTPNFTQSTFTDIKRRLNSYWLNIQKIIVKREQSSQRKNWCRGFSLIETLVAISILLIVMMGPITISSSAARSTSFSSEQVTAFFLAQEGAELAQKARDDLVILQFVDSNPDPAVFTPLSASPWTTFINTTGTYQSCYSTNGCGLTVSNSQTGTITITNCGSSQTACGLYFDGATQNLRSRFTHTVGTNSVTPFTRKITLQNISANEVKVISRVTWRTGTFLREQKVEIETRLFNVYGN